MTTQDKLRAISRRHPHGSPARRLANKMLLALQPKVAVSHPPSATVEYWQNYKRRSLAAWEKTWTPTYHVTRTTPAGEWWSDEDRKAIRCRGLAAVLQEQAEDLGAGTGGVPSFADWWAFARDWADGEGRELPSRASVKRPAILPSFDPWRDPQQATPTEREKYENYKRTVEGCGITPRSLNEWIWQYRTAQSRQASHTASAG